MPHPIHQRTPTSPSPAPPAGARRKAPALGLALVACACLLGCKITVVSGPTEVVAGDTVAYVVEIGDAGIFPPFFVVADVPEGWRLEASTYVGTAGGVPISGNGLVVQSDACEFLMAKRPGFRRWYVQNPTLPPEVTSTDTAQVTLEFVVESQPAGEFSLYFLLAGTECSTPEVFTVNQVTGPRFLSAVQQLVDGGGVDGLGGPVEIERSPDGRHFYAAAGVDASIGVFARDAADGRLSFVEAETEGLDDGLGPPAGLAMSPDGLYLYVPRFSIPNSGSTSGILIFARDPATGALSLLERVIEDVRRAVVSPDGLHLYAERLSELLIFSRDPATGRLAFVDTLPFSGQMEPSPDGLHLYVASDDLLVFERDAMTGALALLDSSTPSGRSPALSPDGRHLYVIASGINVFLRDEATGLLSLVENVPDLITEPVSNAASFLAVSPNGRHVVASSSVALSVFERDPLTGRLSFVECRYMGDLPIDGVSGLVFAADSRHLYTAAFDDDSLTTFATAVVFGDGFESGTTSAWSSAVP